MNRVVNDGHNSDQHSELETSTKFVERVEAEFGDAVVIQNQTTRHKYLMKERVFQNKTSFLDYLGIYEIHSI